MKCIGHLDIHTDSGYRRIESADDVKGYGMRGLCTLRRGVPVSHGHVNQATQSMSHGHVNLIHLLDSVSKTHRLAIRSSYSAEIVGASHGVEDAYPTIITMIELKKGILTAEQLKAMNDKGNIPLKVTLAIDAESVYKSPTSLELKTPAEKTLRGHVMWIREKLHKGIISEVQWCDTRDMTADGHTKGSVEMRALIDLMQGKQVYQFPVKTFKPYHSDQDNPSTPGRLASFTTFLSRLF